MKSAEHDINELHEFQTPDEGYAQSLSAVVDGESSVEGIDLGDAEVRQRWAVYHLIGDALRDPSATVGVTTEFTARMSAALAREPNHGQAVAPVSQAMPSKAVSRWRQAVVAWPGLAVAAAVASVVWVAQPLFELEQQAQSAMSVAQARATEANVQVSQAVRPASDYVSAHRQMAGPIAVRQVAFTPGAD